ncbi:nuclear transport factor 2 family protein [Halomarina ordinaria]|uniref:Nuclear transport factor 2 family protein n=1 Tax=Halomarina ordinaria TaxID=3033939 RepID=A0ABD5UCT1_9EURY|nr:nuclear transport factor 2 family protein [Halomarina sp. PSRA2]
MSPDPDRRPEAVVKRQTEAYNEGDIEAFTACYAEDAVIERLDAEGVVANGDDEIHDQYRELFEMLPELTCGVTDEFTFGEYVACKERVTGTDDPVVALAVYLVRDDVIQHLWLGGEP